MAALSSILAWLILLFMLLILPAMASWKWVRPRLEKGWPRPAIERILQFRWKLSLRPRITLPPDWVLFGIGLSIYWITRWWALDRFPIFFFCDEAIQAVLAEDLLRNGFQDFEGTLLPTFFKNGALWNLSLSVYIHALPVWALGKSIFTTRATSALISLIGTAAVALILRVGFQKSFWWSGVLIMTVIPVWFLHSRTAFENVMMVSFYAWFLLCYFLYRYRSPGYLFPALLFAGAAFYAYAGGQPVVTATLALLGLSDLRYHVRSWRVGLRGILLLIILLLPYLRFHLTHPGEILHHLRTLDSYWLSSASPGEKLTQLARNYLLGLSPIYWFFPNEHDLVRHRMDGYGHIHTWMLPMALLGLGLCIRRIQIPAYRVILLSALAAPVGGALVGISITRVLVFVVPAGILIGLGLDWILTQLSRLVPHRILTAVAFLALFAIALSMARDALTEGPLWFRDYGLYGMQYGAKQIFQEFIPEYLERDPNAILIVSPDWANGADVFPRFFLSLEQQDRVLMLSADYFMQEKRELTPDMVFVLTPEEHERVIKSNKFKPIEVERILPYPDGRPGFFIARLAYVDGVEDVFAAEREARRRPVEEQIVLDGQVVDVRHSLLDMGQLGDLFDGDRFTLIRGLEANPFILEFSFPQPRLIRGLAVDFGTMDFTITIRLYHGEESDPIIYSRTYRGLPSDPHVEIDFEGAPHPVSRIQLEILDLHAGETAHIHIRELTFR